MAKIKWDWQPFYAHFWEQDAGLMQQNLTKGRGKFASLLQNHNGKGDKMKMKRTAVTFLI
jgi:hypothetical protein